MADVIDEDATLRPVLASLDSPVQDGFRRVLMRDQADRDEIAQVLLCYRDDIGRELADIVDMLTMNPEERRKVVRLLGEIEAR